MGGFRNPWLGFKRRKTFIIFRHIVLYSKNYLIINTDSMDTGKVKYLICIPFNSSIFSSVVILKKRNHFSTISQKMENNT